MQTYVHRSSLLIPLCTVLLLSACGGGGGYGGGSDNPPASPPSPLPPSPPAPSQPGSLQFDAASLSVDENAGTASLTVTRTGGSDGAVSVTVSSSNGSATAGSDYTALNTTVSFAAGDAATKTMTVLIADDGEGEADESLSVTLPAPTGGASIGAVPNATLTIRDNDAPTAPVLQVGADIKQLNFTWAGVPAATSYRLLRNPDGASGFVQVGADHPATASRASVEVSVHRHDWVNAPYRLEACNVRGCTASSAVSAMNAMVAGDRLLQGFKHRGRGRIRLFVSVER